MASDWKSSLLAARSRLHRVVFSATDGRLMGRWGGLPVVMITTTGRRTGRPRTTIVVSPLCDGDRIVLVASNGGADTHPFWYRNLVGCPEVEVVMTGTRARLRGVTATPDEAARLWPLIESGSPAYGRYRRRTTRDIPLVLLEPLGS
jgi:deazaflavin-dependent oxidoreductase (nitroreductase family)